MTVKTGDSGTFGASASSSTWSWHPPLPLAGVPYWDWPPRPLAVVKMVGGLFLQALGSPALPALRALRRTVAAAGKRRPGGARSSTGRSVVASAKCAWRWRSWLAGCTCGSTRSGARAAPSSTTRPTLPDAAGSRFFLGHQTWDNIFWTMIYGAPVATAWEVLARADVRAGCLRPDRLRGPSRVVRAALPPAHHVAECALLRHPPDTALEAAVHDGYTPSIIAMSHRPPGRGSRCTRWSTCSTSRRWQSSSCCRATRRTCSSSCSGSCSAAPVGTLRLRGRENRREPGAGAGCVLPPSAPPILRVQLRQRRVPARSVAGNASRRH